MDFITLAAKDLGNVAENMGEYGGKVTLSGLLIVFTMLILLVVIISIFGFIIGGAVRSNKENKVNEPKAENKTVVSHTPAASAAPTSEDEDVIAAISAAVMMMYEGTGKTPIIRSIRPAQKGVRSAWATAGIMNNTRPF